MIHGKSTNQVVKCQNKVFVTKKNFPNLRVDSSGDLDFPQLENSLKVKPFLHTNQAQKRQANTKKDTKQKSGTKKTNKHKITHKKRHTNM